MAAIFWFQAKSNDDQGQPRMLMAGQIERMVIYHPGSPHDAQNYFQQQNFGSPGVRYSIMPFQVKVSYPEPMVLAVQISLGPGRQVSPHDVVLSRQHVHGGQPTGMPFGQRQERGDGMIDPRGHFQELGDASLPLEGDPMFGSVNDGTYADAIMTSFGFQEIPRDR